MNNNEKDNNVNNQEILEESVSSITDIADGNETPPQSNREKYTGEKTRVLEIENFKNEKVVPLVYLESTVNDNEGQKASTEYGNLVSVVTQDGSNSNKYVKSILGMAINKSGGDNDATGVVGYAKKLKEAGKGDTCGAGGAAWQYSINPGMVMGGEFACHQKVAGTTGDNEMNAPNKSLSLHLTTHSDAAPCWGALGIDGHGISEGYYGFWKGISIQESCWNHNNKKAIDEENVNGIYVKNTTGIDFSTNRAYYPETAIELGNASRHLKRRTTGQAIRSQASYHDFCANLGEDTKVRFFMDTDTSGSKDAKESENMQKNRNIQLIFADGELKPESGKEGNISRTTSDLRGSIISFGHDHGISIRTYKKDDKDEKKVYTVAMSPSLASFRPGTDNNISLGTGKYRFKQVYTVNSSIDVSDARQKTEIQDIDEALMRAWGKVSYKTFKMKNAVEEKGEKARIHTGLIAQDIIEAFESENLDAFKYGLVCKDVWEEEEPIYDIETRKAVNEENGVDLCQEEVKKELLSEGRAAGEVLSVRYNECYALESAYQRWRLEQLENLLKEK